MTPARNTLGLGCLVLFLLPFATTGAVTGGLAVLSALDGQWQEALFLAVFALGFGGVGIGGIAAAIAGGRKLKEQAAHAHDRVRVSLSRAGAHAERAGDHGCDFDDGDAIRLDAVLRHHHRSEGWQEDQGRPWDTRQARSRVARRHDQERTRPRARLASRRSQIPAGHDGAHVPVRCVDVHEEVAGLR